MAVPWPIAFKGLDMRIVLKILIISLLMASAVLVGTYQGYRLGYAKGEQMTNNWWIDKKSLYYDSREIEKKRIIQHHNAI